MNFPTAHNLANANLPAEDLVEQMRRRWKASERVAVEEFLERHPSLANQPHAAVDLIYEEYCLRRAAGEHDVESDLLRRFPQWSHALGVMLQCHRLLDANQPATCRFPRVGEKIGEFEILQEIGGGSRGRVFLARQSTLADRPIVLKIIPLDGAGEHLSLARLQHTNIVPLYSVIDDAERAVRVLCMPFFGRATLATLLQTLAAVPPEQRGGRHVIEVIDRGGDGTLGAIPNSPARQLFQNVSYVQALCWIGACLADALHFAHERGVAHFDLKPSNVLLAFDGQPMLLDFHLARPPLRAGQAAPENFGGTPPYMSPEQLQAMQALREGHSPPTGVDGRADVFALGAMLYESLGGELPMTDSSPPLHAINAQVSMGLSDIVARCIAARANNRYPDAGQLADDLRRHLTDQPLAGVSNRSISERWSKWRRRRPQRLRGLVAAGAILLALIGVIGGTGLFLRDRHQQAQAALDEARRLLHENQPDRAAEALGRGLSLIENLPFEQTLTSQLREELQSARRLELGRAVHRLADEIRPLYGQTNTLSSERQDALAAQCRAFWVRRAEIIKALQGQGPSVSEDLRDIAIIAAELETRLAGDATTGHQQAIRILEEASATFGDGVVLELERRIHQAAISGEASLISNFKSQISNLKSEILKLKFEISDSSSSPSAWRHYALGRAFLTLDDPEQARRHLTEALRIDPAGRWTNFYFGLCAYRLGEYEDCVSAMSVCIGADPAVAEFFHNRALALSALGRAEQARRDFDRALELSR